MRVKSLLKILVLLRLDIMPGRQELVGIFRYVKRKGLNWDIQLRTPAEITPELISGSDAPNGIISAEYQLSHIANVIVQSEIPVVSLDEPPEIFSNRKANIVFVRADNEAIGRKCMQHLASKGRFASWGFVHDVHCRSWSVSRQQSFEAAVRQAGQKFVPMTDTNEAALPKWLNALPKPAAIMTACDRRALQVLEVCRQQSLDIPQQIAIVSVDNDEMYCECVSPSISSMDPDFENEGYLAAAELDRMLRRKTSQPARTIIAPSRGVVDRESTTPVSMSAHLVHRAMSFITKNACKGIKVQDVVQELGVSRRLADLRFQQYHGKPIHETIISLRLVKVKKLLSRTDLSISKIATICGFNNPKNLAIAFRKHFNLSMRAFREQVRQT